MPALSVPTGGARVLVGAVVVAVIGVSAAVVLAGREDGGRAPAATVLADTSRFTTPRRAVTALDEVTRAAGEEAQRCRRSHGVRAACQAWSAAAGYSAVAATLVAGCTAPGRERVRRQVAAYVDHVARLPLDSAVVPDPPEPPSCR